MTNKTKKPKTEDIHNKEMMADMVNCLAVFSINKDTEILNFHGASLKKRDYNKQKILKEYRGEERLIIIYRKQNWVYLTTDFFEKAKIVIEEVKGGIDNIWIDRNKKNTPIVLSSEDMAIVIAPRVENE